MPFILGLGLAYFGSVFGDDTAFGAFPLTVFSFSAGVTWAGITRESGQ